MTRKYRKKPIVIEAVQFDGSHINAREIAAWAATVGHPEVSPGVGSHDGYATEILRVPTLEGVMVAGPSDWIIRGVAGEIYPCRDRVFVATYEPAE